MLHEYYLSELFAVRPRQFGLRGDAYLWNDMEAHFSTVPFGCSVDLLLNEIDEVYFLNVGKILVDGTRVYVPKYAHGGLSSGYVSGEFWIRSAKPLIEARYYKLSVTHLFDEHQY